MHHSSSTEEMKILRRIEELLTALVRATLADAVASQLKDKKHRILYEGTGRLSVRELSDKTGFSMGKISGLWQKWEQAGLLVKDGSKYKKVL